MSLRYKYPRTYHVPWSPNLKNDDRMHPDMSIFDGKNVVVTIKMDGENTTWYNDGYHARSIDSQNSNHPSRDYVKGIWARHKYLIPNNRRICGENIYALHSIEYVDLESYFQVFSIWEDNLCLSWKQTKEICNEMGLITVPVLYSGIYDKEYIEIAFGDYNFNEGYVIRIEDEFIHDFNKEYFFSPMSKYVRENHVQTEEHWLKNWNKTKINKLRT